MLRKLKKDGLAWYEFSLFDRCPELAHGVFTRAGGVSGPEGQDLNLAFNELDPPENVMINLRRAEAALGLSPAAFARQTHGLNILVVRPGDGYRPAAPAEVRQDYDAVIAPEPGVSLLVKLADCQGIMLYDQTRRMLGLVHSGWRGSARNIIGAAAAKMKELGART
ncbi:MAG: polyphenol oxidase family protein, partial [Candidatus Adiutrix sp.]|nr:polyphenol oxidase family protein [Candidatus Adiutrix sp.]